MPPKRVAESSSAATRSEHPTSKRVRAAEVVADAPADDYDYESDEDDADADGGGDEDGEEEDDEDEDEDDEDDDEEDEGLGLEMKEGADDDDDDDGDDDDDDEGEGGKEGNEGGKGASSKPRGSKASVKGAAAARKGSAPADAKQKRRATAIDVEFRFQDPAEIDFKSVRRLLMGYVPAAAGASASSSSSSSSSSPAAADFDASAMAEAIIAQRVLGTMVKVDDDLDVYSFATILPVARLREQPWLGSVRALVLDRCRDAAQRKRLAELFAGDSLGLLVSERMLNVPAELAPTLAENLCADLAWAREKSALAEDREAFGRVKHLLLLAPCWAPPADVLPGTGAGAGARTGTGAGAALATHSFLHFEEQCYAAEATADFSFAEDAPAAASAPASAAGKALRSPRSRRVLVLPAAALPKCVAAMKSLLDAASAAEAAAMAAAASAAPAAKRR